MLLKDDDYRLLEECLTNVFDSVYRQGILDKRVSRWALKLEPLNPETYPKGNTRLYNRWELPDNPPTKLAHLAGLYASEEDCYAAKHRLMAQIVFMEDATLYFGLFNNITDLRQRLLKYDRTLDQGVICPITKLPVTIADIKSALLQFSRIGSSEINIDFIDVSGNGGRLDPNNLHWVKPPHYLYALRKAVLDTTHLKPLLDKVQMNAYLTYRRQTGVSATNRDRRWEVSPRDSQFTLYKDCIRVEARLLAQVFEFTGAPVPTFPSDVLEQIQQATGCAVKSGSFRCPVSGQEVRYERLAQCLQEQKYGPCPYQITHLTSVDNSGRVRHIAENLSWVTELGNRLLGDNPVEKVVGDIVAMAKYHQSVENPLRHSPAYYTCFISFSNKDQGFAKQLYTDLQSQGVSCWYAPEDLKIGAKIRPSIDASIYRHDKLIIVLSQHSLASQWVEQEVETALAVEREEKRTILFPIRLDENVMEFKSGWPALIRNTRNIGDFTNWQGHDAYLNAFIRLLRDLQKES